MSSSTARPSERTSSSTPAAGPDDSARPTGPTPCGVAYAARLYALRAGATPGPIRGEPGLFRAQQGFVCLLFVHDAGTFPVLFVRATEDRDLTCLRHPEVFDAATRLLPEVAAWVDPARALPVDTVRAGAGLTNSYRPQPTQVHRLLAIGDAVSTTNPVGARGISLGMGPAAALTDIVTSVPEEEWAPRHDAWCAQNLKPWFDEHVATDTTLADRLRGSFDMEAFIPWDVVAAAADVRPDFMPTLGPFLAMATPRRASTLSARRFGPCSAPAGGLPLRKDRPGTTCSQPPRQPSHPRSRRFAQRADASC